MSNIEEHIRRAIEEGKFDNLPGKGKPLQLDDNPLADPEWRLANHILRNAGFTLPWIEMRKEIEEKLLEARIALKRSWDWRESAAERGEKPAEVEPDWKQASERFSEQIAEINKLIRAYNLAAPNDRLQLPLLNTERELRLTTTSLSDTLAEL